MARAETVPVWDGLVRLFHWSLVASVTVAAITGFVLGGPAIGVHLWAGGVIGFLVLLRLIWGFLGGSYARFSNFVVGPKPVIDHLAALRQGGAPRHLGHNPLGALMIVVLLLLLAASLVTGTMFLGGVFKAGPFGAVLTYDAGFTVGRIHKALAIALMLLVAAHIAGALFESWRVRENLVLAMISGRKRRAHGPEIPKVASRPLLTAGLMTACMAVLVVVGLVMSKRPIQGMPLQVEGSQYASACSDCHATFHPSLLPGKSWQSLMTQLSTHFGEDASLGAADQAAITSFLVAHAADLTDTKPGHVFRLVDAGKPLEITASPFWQRTHAHLSDDVFASSAVGSRANCSACHADATAGWFYPGNVEIPDQSQGDGP